MCIRDSAYTELMNIQSGKILGIGVELGIDQTGYAKVTRVYDGSPAQEAGIAVGDYITTVGDTDVKSPVSYTHLCQGHHRYAGFLYGAVQGRCRQDPRRGCFHCKGDGL